MSKDLQLKMPKLFLILMVGYFTGIVFLENFVLSSDFSILSLRCVDDVAFQSSLYNFFKKRGLDLLFMNDYGYGWFFWFPIYILTYPAHLLMSASGVSWLLIILPRMHSLFFAVMCSIVTYKIASMFTNNEWIKMAVVMLLPIFPACGYMAGRFSPNNQVAFFSILSVYLLIKHESLDRKKLRCVLCTFALAMATKASAICIAPMLALLILSKYQWKFSKNNLLIWMQEILLSVFVMLFFMSPALVFAFLNGDNAKQSAQTLLSYILERQTGGNLTDNLIYAIGFSIGKTAGICLLIMLLLSAFILYKNHASRWKDYFWITVGYFIGFGYLAFTVNVGSIYVFTYSFPVCFAFSFGLIGLQYLKIKKEIVKRILIIAVSFSFTMLQIYRMAEKMRNGSDYNLLAYFQTSRELSEKKDSIFTMEQAINQLKLEQINLGIDYLGPISFYSMQEHKNVLSVNVYWNNMASMQNDHTNLIVLSKDSIGFYEEADFENVISSLGEEEKDTYLADRKIRNQLVTKGYVSGKEWEKAYEDDYVYIYKAK